MESLENRRSQRRRETAMHLSDILERATLMIANQDRIEVLADWSVTSITKSRLCRTRIFCHAAERCPGLYTLSRRFATMPSNP